MDFQAEIFVFMGKGRLKESSAIETSKRLSFVSTLILVFQGFVYFVRYLISLHIRALRLLGAKSL